MNTPTINWARPHDSRVDYQLYIADKIAVRVLNSGVVEVKTGYGDWREV